MIDRKREKEIEVESEQEREREIRERCELREMRERGVIEREMRDEREMKR